MGQEKKYDVYLSSTFDDLQIERNRVAQIIRSEFKWTLQDSYSASHQAVLPSCLADVASARIYVGILGRCYGSLADTEEGWSYTQHEFEHAIQLGIPTFVFLKAGGFDQMDDDQARIKAFRSRVTAARRAAVFKPNGAASETLDAALSKCREEMTRLRNQALGVHSSPSPDEAPVRQQLAAEAALLSLPAPLADRWAAVADAVRTLLAAPPLSFDAAALAELDKARRHDDGLPLATGLINRLTDLVKRRNEQHLGQGWDQAQTAIGLREQRQLDCRTAMKLMFGMAPTEAAWTPALWRLEQGPLPFRDHHLLMAVFNVADRRNFQLDCDLTAATSGKPAQLTSDWVLDLTAIEAGVGRKRFLQQRVAEKFGVDFQQLDRAPDGSLSRDGLDDLAAEVYNLQDQWRHGYVVTESLGADQPIDHTLVKAADDLYVRALPRRAADDCACLREREKILANAVAQCLAAIRNIP